MARRTGDCPSCRHFRPPQTPSGSHVEEPDWWSAHNPVRAGTVKSGSGNELQARDDEADSGDLETDHAPGQARF